MFACQCFYAIFLKKGILQQKQTSKKDRLGNFCCGGLIIMLRIRLEFCLYVSYTSGKVIYCNIILIMWVFCLCTKAPVFVFVAGEHRRSHTMFVKGFCEIFSKKVFNTAINRAFVSALCVLFRFPLYRYGWFLCLNVLKCRQVLQCPFEANKRFSQKDDENYEETPYSVQHWHFHISL